MRRRRLIWALVLVVVAVVAWSQLNRLSRARCYQLVGELSCRVETDQKLIALTIDDGPTPDGVATLLPMLERYDVKATFFLVGEMMERHPQEARRLVQAGHELGNHTYTHKRMLLRWPSTYAEEVERTDKLLRAAGEADPRLFRPPYGHRLIGLPMAVDRAGYRTVMWDVEEAYFETRPTAYAERITSQARPGSIILVHAMTKKREFVRKALPIIIEDLQARGFRLVTVSELLAAGEG